MEILKHGQFEPKRSRQCATMEKHWHLVRADPEYCWRRRQIEFEIQDWIKRYG